MTAVATPSHLDPKSLGERAYRLKQRSLAAVLGATTGAIHALMGPRGQKSDPKALGAIDALHDEALARDYANAEAGLYPKSLLVPLPGWHDVRYLAEAVLDMPRIVWRKRRGAEGVRIPAKALQAGVEFPDYYRRAFHWQTDGWMSEHSARIYEVQVEFLFFGAMDVMRRAGLAELVRALDGDRHRMRVKVLDVACGTGRLLEQMRVTLPQATLDGVDLSPFYVDRAEERMKGHPASKVTVANAESMPFDEGAYDAVTCGFLFHELPKDARQRVARELFRVLEPGGVLVVQDSMQRTDPNAKDLLGFLDWFPVAYHEPYYKGYTKDDLAKLLAEAGFVVEKEEHVLFSKVVVARKPLG